jgi:hypothetical protein
LDRPSIVFNIGIAGVAYEHNGCVIVSPAENVVFKQRTVKTSRLQAAGAKTEATSIRLFAIHGTTIATAVTSGDSSLCLANVAISRRRSRSAAVPG